MAKFDVRDVEIDDDDVLDAAESILRKLGPDDCREFAEEGLGVEIPDGADLIVFLEQFQALSSAAQEKAINALRENSLHDLRLAME